MRTFFILLLFPLMLSAQQKDEVGQNPYFVALYTLGETWDIEKPPQEQAYFKEHSAFLQGLRKANQITIGARYGETGMLILQAENLEAAEALLNADVAVQNQLFNVQVQLFSPFYKGCID